MAPDDLYFLVAYIVGMIGEHLGGVGSAFSFLAADPLVMDELTIGIFGEQGGLIYWCNEKLLWLMENILEGLTFSLL